MWQRAIQILAANHVPDGALGQFFRGKAEHLMVATIRPGPGQIQPYLDDAHRRLLKAGAKLLFALAYFFLVNKGNELACKTFQKVRDRTE